MLATLLLLTSTKCLSGFYTNLCTSRRVCECGLRECVRIFDKGLLITGRSTDNLSTLTMVFIMVGVVKGVFISFALIAVCFRFEPTRLYVCVYVPRQCALEYAFVCKCAVSVLWLYLVFCFGWFSTGFCLTLIFWCLNNKCCHPKRKLFGVFRLLFSYGLF